MLSPREQTVEEVALEISHDLSIPVDEARTKVERMCEQHPFFREALDHRAEALRKLTENEDC